MAGSQTPKPEENREQPSPEPESSHNPPPANEPAANGSPASELATEATPTTSEPTATAPPEIEPIREPPVPPCAQEWADLDTAPGDDIVKFKAIRILDSEGELAESLLTTQSVKIEIEFVVLRGGKYLQPTCFSGMAGQCTILVDRIKSRIAAHSHG